MRDGRQDIVIERLADLKDYRKPVSPGGVANALRCPRLFLYRNKWRLLPKAFPVSHPLEFGSLLHWLLEVGPDRAPDVEAGVKTKCDALTATIGAGGDLLGDVREEMRNISLSYQKARAVASIFWKRFPPLDYIKVIAREKRLETTIAVGEIKLPLVGILDALVQDTRDGAYWIRDTKTTSRPFQLVYAGYSWSLACRMYRLLASAAGSPPKGFILDMVTRPSIKLCAKDIKNASAAGVTPEEAYLERVQAWYDTQQGAGRDTIASHAVFFRGDVKPPELMKALEHAAQLWAADTSEPSEFRRDPTQRACSHFNVCPYHQLCDSSPATWVPVIMDQYVIEPGTGSNNEHKETDNDNDND